MTTITVSGHSDDLIEIDGDLSEEWDAYSTGDFDGSEEGAYLTFSSGTLLRIRYTTVGVWRIDVLALGVGTDVAVAEAPDEDDDDYSDIATVTIHTGHAKPWVVSGDRRKAAR